jgi:hypothetical protein
MNTQLDMSLGELEAALESESLPPLDLVQRFIDSCNADTFEQRLAQASPELRERVIRCAKNNILSFDGILEECERLGRYVGGWVAMRAWARRQPWVGDAIKVMAPVLARMRHDQKRDALRKAHPAYPEHRRLVDDLERKLEGTKDHDAYFALQDALLAEIARFESLVPCCGDPGCHHQ